LVCSKADGWGSGTAGDGAGVVVLTDDENPEPVAVEFLIISVGKLEFVMIEVKLVQVPLMSATQAGGLINVELDSE
jgi:hypothetical protein